MHSKSSALHLPPDGKLRALTVREPFASLIVMGLKPIENRTLKWPATLPLPCTIAIHASTDGSVIADDIGSVLDVPYVDAAFVSDDYETHVSGREYFYGGTIIGLVDVVACVCVSEMSDDELESTINAYPWDSEHISTDALRSDWANGPYCLILDNPRRFKTGVVCRGQLNYWTIPSEKMTLVSESMKSLLMNPQDLPSAPVGGVAKWLGRKVK